MTSFYYYDPNPSGVCFLVQNKGFCFLNLAGITKFKYDRKNEKDSGRSSKMTPSCKWPVVLKWLQEGLNQTLACRAELALCG